MRSKHNNSLLSATSLGVLCGILFPLPTLAQDLSCVNPPPSIVSTANSSSTKNTLSNSIVLPQKAALPSTTSFDTLNHYSIAEFLGWVHDASNSTNLCSGYYLEPAVITQFPNPPEFTSAPTTITATKPAFFSQYGLSTLTGDVTITQPGRQVIADLASFDRDATTGQVRAGALVGNVKFREYGKIIVAKDGHWDTKTKALTLNHGIYRLSTPTPTGTMSAWGKAKKMVRNAAGVIKINKGTYTTCSPLKNTWSLWGNKVVLNKNTGRGSISHAVLFVHYIPVFYLPYINFPIDNTRKSGFLYPGIGFSGNSGLDLSIPYYLNLAPNYDALLTPRILSKRGLLGDGLFRYITPSSHGTLNVDYISHDNAFGKFQKDALQQYKPSYSLSRLENASSDRGFISYKNETDFSEYWSSGIDLNYVTDDYFFQDFGGAATSDNDQLFNQVNVKYASENWYFSTLVQNFETLHPINQSPTSNNQYRRVPQVNLNGDFPDKAYGLNYQLHSELVNFDFDHKYYANTGLIKPIGNRLNLTPGVSLPLSWSGGFLIPQLQLNSTLYSLHNNLLPQSATNNDINRTLPVFSADSGLVLTRNATLFNNNYTQMLEPRLFYLYAPLHNQKDIPIFDSNLSNFDFEQLFAINRFSGQDLVGDANQISVGVTTRFLDTNTAEEKFSASIGQMFLLQKHHVCIYNDCSSDPLVQHNISPLVGELQYYLTQYWDASSTAALDPNNHKFNNGAFNIKYHNGVNRIASLGYNFVKHGDYMKDARSDDLHRLNLSFAWPIKIHWNIVADWNYNISHNHPQEYFYGAEYQSCCWAIRLVHNQTFIGTDENHRNTFQRAVYLQFLFKGLSSVGTSNAGTTLTTQIPGYQDNFNSMK